MNIEKLINQYAVKYEGQSMASMQSTIDLLNGKGAIVQKPKIRAGIHTPIVEDTISEDDLPTIDDLEYMRGQGINV